MAHSYRSQYRAIVDFVGRTDRPTLADIVHAKVAKSLTDGRPLARVSIGYRVNELVDLGVLHAVGTRPTRYKVGDLKALHLMEGTQNYQRTPLNALQSAVEEAGDKPAVYEPDASAGAVGRLPDDLMDTLKYDNLWPQLEPIFDKWIEGYASVWEGEIADLNKQVKDRDAKIAELEAKLSRLKELFA